MINSLRKLLFGIPFVVLFAFTTQAQSSIATTSEVPACHFFESNSLNLIGTDNFSFEAMIDNSDTIPLPNGAQMGCILKAENPKWVLVKILSGDSLNFVVSNTAGKDVDAAMWGPILNQDINNACEILSSFPFSCDANTSDPHLVVTDCQVGDYFLLLITNFANFENEISIGQPSGGSVKYHYYCPENIKLDDPLSGEQLQYAKNSISLRSELSTSTKLQAFSGNSIELLPGFESGDNVVFESKIQVCNLDSTSYSPPIVPVVCESFDNHTSASPHLYANTLQNELVGTVFAKTRPQYRVGSEWFDMEKLGLDRQGERYLWYYRHPFSIANNTALRTGPTCPHYDDIRYSAPQAYLGTEDTPLPNLPAVQSYLDIDSPFYLSTNIVPNQSFQRMEAIYLKYDVNANLNYSINGGSFKFNVEKFDGYEPFSNRHLRVARIAQNDAPKDFILDFRINRETALDRYIVTRNSAGGHFAVNTTITRLADSTVYVTTFQGDMDTPMKLGPYEPTELFGCTFYLGKLPEGTYYFPLTSRKEEVVLDEQVMVRVRYN